MTTWSGRGGRHKRPAGDSHAHRRRTVVRLRSTSGAPDEGAGVLVEGTKLEIVLGVGFDGPELTVNGLCVHADTAAVAHALVAWGLAMRRDTPEDVSKGGK